MKDGFQLYDQLHIMWLLLSVGIVIGMCYIYVRLSTKQKRRMRLSIAWAFIIAEVIKNGYIWHYETWKLNALPLELCALAMFAIFIHAYTKNRAVGEMLFALFLPGAIGALLFPEWTYRPLTNFISIHSFLYHIAIVGYVCMMLYAKEIVPTIKRLWQPALLIAVIVPLIYMLNQWLHTNFFYLSRPAKGSPIEWLAHIFGNPGYIFGLVLCLLFIWLVMYSVLYSYRRIQKPLP